MKKFYQTLGLGMMILTTSAGASSPLLDLSEIQGISRPSSAVTLPVTPFILNLHDKSESEGPKLSQPHNRTSNMPYDLVQKGTIELDSQSSTDSSHRLHTLLPLSCVQDVSHLSLDPATHQAIVYKKPGSETSLDLKHDLSSSLVLHPANITNLPWNLDEDRLKSFVSQHTARLVPLDETYKLDFTGGLLGGSFRGEWGGFTNEPRGSAGFYRDTHSILNTMAPRFDTVNETVRALNNTSSLSGSMTGSSRMDAFQMHRADREFASVSSLAPSRSSVSAPSTRADVLRSLEVLTPSAQAVPSLQEAIEASIRSIESSAPHSLIQAIENTRRSIESSASQPPRARRDLGADLQQIANNLSNAIGNPDLSTALDISCGAVHMAGVFVPPLRLHPVHQTASVACGVRSVGKALNAIPTSTPAPARPTISAMASKPMAAAPAKPAPAPAKHVGSHQPIRVPDQLPAFPDAKLIDRINNRKTWVDKKYYYQADTLHGAVEKYYKGSEQHVGEFNYNTGVQTKPADPRKILRKS